MRAISHVLSSWCDLEHFTYIFTRQFPDSTKRTGLLLSRFCRWGDWASGKELAPGREPACVISSPRCLIPEPGSLITTPSAFQTSVSRVPSSWLASSLLLFAIFSPLNCHCICSCSVILGNYTQMAWIRCTGHIYLHILTFFWCGCRFTHSSGPTHSPRGVPGDNVVPD